MPQATSLLLDTFADEAQTLATETFNVVSNEGGKTLYEVKTDQLIGNPRLRVEIVRPKAGATGQRNTRIRFIGERPTLEQAATGGEYVPPPMLAYRVVCSAEFVIPERATRLERMKIRKMMKSIISDATVTGIIDDYETIW